MPTAEKRKKAADSNSRRKNGPEDGKDILIRNKCVVKKEDTK